PSPSATRKRWIALPTASCRSATCTSPRTAKPSSPRAAARFRARLISLRTTSSKERLPPPACSLRSLLVSLQTAQPSTGHRQPVRRSPPVVLQRSRATSPPRPPVSPTARHTLVQPHLQVQSGGRVGPSTHGSNEELS